MAGRSELNRILLEPEEIRDGVATLRDGRFAHIRNVLRAQPGDRLRAGVIDGARHEAELTSIDARSCALKLVREHPPLDEPTVDLLLALPRPKRLRRLWPQLAAIGVRRLYLANAEKVDRGYWGSHLLDPVEYRPLLLEGLAQAGDTRLPHVHLARRLKPLVEDVLAPGYATGFKWIAHPGARRGQPPAATGVRLLAVGPEGGWSAYELDMFEACGFETFSLGDRTLRTDTACIALLAVFSQPERF
ncbi:MAG: 16S rRNA (uracil(1498)-N(3))-methyltransferase [Kiritimatiellia bacterium]|jgi:16S rRNA (uracil1498-N3)-methyltransferase